MAIDLPPKLWVPPAPAIIRPASPEIIAPVLGITMLAQMSMVRARRADGSSLSSYNTLAYQGIDLKTSEASSYTFASKALGTEDPNRHIIVGYAHHDGNLTVSTLSCTIAGVAATTRAELHYVSGGDKIWIAFFEAAVPTGTSGDIVTTTDHAVASPCISWYSVNMPSGVASASSSGSSATAGTPNCSFAIPANGFALVASANKRTVDNAHSINDSFTEDGETYANGANFDINFACSQRAVVGSATANVTSTWASSGQASVILGASWQ